MRYQRNLRVHVSIALIAVTLGWLIGLSSLEWALVVLTMASVLTLELVNTGIEALVDLVSPGQHHLAAVAKDAAAGAVLVAAAASVVVGLLVYGPQLGHFGQRFMIRWQESPAVIVAWGVVLALCYVVIWGVVPARKRREGGQNRIGGTP
ncbi:MAG: diacylglycerol kinase [Sulfobacillus acidophilus]|uniref:Diacylglycerol kinase n=1 Tax=Sulfobacillus acidophilus TaxID=53633 RepID=A0A2T2WN73_9FIRM|nr:MAG: diacylglycerol kinase [Sulfobacillus acidophilus]